MRTLKTELKAQKRSFDEDISAEGLLLGIGDQTHRPGKKTA
jgi:hypothetical protein